MSNTTKIYYVGKKADQPGGESAFADLTGIVWRRFDECHEIDSRIASRMLQHPDVFSDKTPEERADAERRALELQKAQAAAAAQQHTAGGMAALLAALPPGTVIRTPEGSEIALPGGASDAEREARAKRLAQFTDPDNGDANSDDSGLTDAPVQETPVRNVDTTGVNLAPGGTVAALGRFGSGQAPATAPAAKPQAAAPAPKAATAKGR